MILGHALEDIPEIGEGLHIIEFCRGDEGTDGRPTLSAAIGTGEQMVLAPKRDGSDRVLSLRRETSVRIGLRGALDTMSVTDPRATCCRMPRLAANRPDHESLLSCATSATSRTSARPVRRIRAINRHPEAIKF